MREKEKFKHTFKSLPESCAGFLYLLWLMFFNIHTHICVDLDADLNIYIYYICIISSGGSSSVVIVKKNKNSFNLLK